MELSIPKTKYKNMLHEKQRKSALLEYFSQLKRSISFIAIFAILFLSLSSLYAKRIPLAWQEAKDVKHYILEIATDSLFQNIIQTKKLKESFINAYLDPGVYYLRVAAVSKKGIQGYFSDVRIIEIKSKKKKAPPKLVAKKLSSSVEKENKVEERTRMPDVAPLKRVIRARRIGVRLNGKMDRQAVWDPINKIFVPAQRSGKNGNNKQK